MPKTNTFSLSLSRETAHVTSECQTRIKENTVLNYHFPFFFGRLVSFISWLIQSVKIVIVFNKVIFSVWQNIPPVDIVILIFHVKLGY